MFFFAPFTNSIMCGMRAQYTPFPSYKKRTVLAPVGLSYYKFRLHGCVSSQKSGSQNLPRHLK